MIVFKDNKGFEQRDDVPFGNWTDEDCYVIEDNTILANKIVQAYPFYNFITNEHGELIDIEVLENPNKLLELKQVKVSQSKQQLEEFLENNPLQFTDGKFYSVTKEKQTLLANALQVYQIKVQAGLPATLKWNTTGDICREFTLEEITGLVVAITEYVQPRVEKQQALEVQIRNAETLEELDSIVIDYEVV